MKEYELFTVIKPHMDSDEVTKLVDKIEEQVAQYGGKTLSTDKIGRKKLSYEINKFRDGFFVVHRMQIPAEKVADLKRQLKLNENILRNMLVRAEKVSA